MRSWKRPVDCTMFETRTVSGGSKPNENLIPEKVYSADSGAVGVGFPARSPCRREVCYWHRLAFAFITYHRRRGLPLRSDEIERQLVGSFVVLGEEGNGLSVEEESFVKACFETPDGWDEEVVRLEPTPPTRIPPGRRPKSLRAGPGS